MLFHHTPVFLKVTYKGMQRYFAADAADEVVDLAMALTGVCSVARNLRFLSRFAACFRLRMFSRAFSFGMVGLLECCSHPTLLQHGAPGIAEY
jgi:hypothetical protein